MSAGQTAQPLSWSTKPSALIALSIGGVVLVVAAFFATDGPSRLLIGLAAIAVVGMAIVGFRQRPRLTVVPGKPPSLIVGTFSGPKTYPLDQIERIAIPSYRRIGRRTAMLEIDVRDGDNERLLIFGRWDLGANPNDVYDALVVNGFASVARTTGAS
ncbi:PH domain-containing protein [Nocardia camponoti]|uniref:Low molecular weight protein antigen 6 PH domain-containing protein n=1 Tax=Nocardia camponoti TaxID=1616106 RepID=A0A917QKC6_9NOCA|nr:PH domain-containing protein [Nocardia camponoti]GGK54723.1 hypothetical protein GCM10011591_28210 [Nocardia camponoti]